MAETARHCRVCGAKLILGENWTCGTAKHHNYLCQRCRKIQSRCYYESHKELAKKQRRLRYIANKERSAEQSYRWREQHPERSREIQRRWARRNPDKKREATLRWRKEHPGKVREQWRRRAARKAGAMIEPVDEAFIYERGRYACVYCSGPLNLTLDHVAPLSKGGEHKYDNLVVACRSCNCSKGAKDVFEWLATRRAT